MAEGWVEINGQSHYFLDERIASCGRLQSLCGREEVAQDTQFGEAVNPHERCTEIKSDLDDPRRRQLWIAR